MNLMKIPREMAGGGVLLTGLNSQAIELNRTIENLSPPVLDLLSKKGRAIYYPSKGILAQGAAARNKEINATIGTAYEDDGRAMVIPSLMRGLNLPPESAFPYAPSEGLKTLREKWQELIKIKNPDLGATEISLPVITCGVTHGLSLIGYFFVDEGEDILLSDLYWENYDLVFGNAFGYRRLHSGCTINDQIVLAHRLLPCWNPQQTHEHGNRRRHRQQDDPSSDDGSAPVTGVPEWLNFEHVGDSQVGFFHSSQ